MDRASRLTAIFLGAAATSLAACKSDGAPSASNTEPSPNSAPSATSAAAPATSSAGAQQYFPLQSYRVGPYAAGGTGF